MCMLGVIEDKRRHGIGDGSNAWCESRCTRFTPNPIRVFITVDELHDIENVKGVMIAVECKDHAGKRLFYIEGPTDDNGLYIISVNSEHRHEHCEAYTIRNPTSCNIPSDSNRSPVSLTHNNDIDSNERKIGPFSFRSTKSHPACKAMMAEYTVDHKAGPASVVSVHTNGAKHLLSQVEEEEHIERGQTFQSRTRNCCGDDYCHSCNSAVEEEAAAGVDYP